MTAHIGHAKDEVQLSCIAIPISYGKNRALCAQSGPLHERLRAELTAPRIVGSPGTQNGGLEDNADTPLLEDLSDLLQSALLDGLHRKDRDLIDREHRRHSALPSMCDDFRTAASPKLDAIWIALLTRWVRCGISIGAHCAYVTPGTDVRFAEEAGTRPRARVVHVIS